MRILLRLGGVVKIDIEEFGARIQVTDDLVAHRPMGDTRDCLPALIHSQGGFSFFWN